MYGEVHINRVFYREVPKVGNRFRQISVHELETFLVLVHEGEVVQEVPFRAESPDAEAYPCATLDEAMAEVESQVQRATLGGWKRYA